MCSRDMRTAAARYIERNHCILVQNMALTLTARKSYSTEIITLVQVESTNSQYIQSSLNHFSLRTLWFHEDI